MQPSVLACLGSFTNAVSSSLATLPGFAYRAVTGQEGHVWEKLGVSKVSRPKGPLLWFHAVNIGECAVALPVILRCLLEYNEHVHVLLTTCSTEAHALLSNSLPCRVILQYVPLQNSVCMRAFLAHWKPQACILMESPAWPLLVELCAAAGVWLGLLNARMSSRPFLSWFSSRVSRALLGQVLTHFSLIVPQSDIDVGRFRVLGASLTQMPGWCSDLKYAAALGTSVWHPWRPKPSRVASLKRALGSRPVWVAAHTAPGEEDVIAAVHRVLSREWTGLITVLLPHMPGRCREVAEMLTKDYLLKVVQWSQVADALTAAPTAALPTATTAAPASSSYSNIKQVGRNYSRAAGSLGCSTPAAAAAVSSSVDAVALLKGVDIVLVDVHSDLPLLYSVSEVAFIGNSLLEGGGGHSLAEAAVAGCAVLVGEHAGHFNTMADELNQAAVLAAEEASAAVNSSGPMEDPFGYTSSAVDQPPAAQQEEEAEFEVHEGIEEPSPRDGSHWRGVLDPHVPCDLSSSGARRSHWQQQHQQQQQHRPATAPAAVQVVNFAGGNSGGNSIASEDNIGQAVELASSSRSDGSDNGVGAAAASARQPAGLEGSYVNQCESQHELLRPEGIAATSTTAAADADSVPMHYNVNGVAVEPAADADGHLGPSMQQVVLLDGLGLMQDNSLWSATYAGPAPSIASGTPFAITGDTTPVSSGSIGGSGNCTTAGEGLAGPLSAAAAALQQRGQPVLAPGAPAFGALGHNGRPSESGSRQQHMWQHWQHQQQQHRISSNGLHSLETPVCPQSPLTPHPTPYDSAQTMGGRSPLHSHSGDISSQEFSSAELNEQLATTWDSKQRSVPGNGTTVLGSECEGNCLQANGCQPCFQQEQAVAQQQQQRCDAAQQMQQQPQLQASMTGVHQQQLQHEAAQQQQPPTQLLRNGQSWPSGPSNGVCNGANSNHLLYDRPNSPVPPDRFSLAGDGYVGSSSNSSSCGGLLHSAALTWDGNLAGLAGLQSVNGSEQPSVWYRGSDGGQPMAAASAAATAGSPPQRQMGRSPTMSELVQCECGNSSSRHSRSSSGTASNTSAYSARAAIGVAAGSADYVVASSIASSPTGTCYSEATAAPAVGSAASSSPVPVDVDGTEVTVTGVQLCPSVDLYPGSPSAAEHAYAHCSLSKQGIMGWEEWSAQQGQQPTCQQQQVQQQPAGGYNSLHNTVGDNHGASSSGSGSQAAFYSMRAATSACTDAGSVGISGCVPPMQRAVAAALNGYAASAPATLRMSDGGNGAGTSRLGDPARSSHYMDLEHPQQRVRLRQRSQSIESDYTQQPGSSGASSSSHFNNLQHSQQQQQHLARVSGPRLWPHSTAASAANSGSNHPGLGYYLEHSGSTNLLDAGGVGTPSSTAGFSPTSAATDSAAATPLSGNTWHHHQPQHMVSTSGSGQEQQFYSQHHWRSRFNFSSGGGSSSSLYGHSAASSAAGGGYTPRLPPHDEGFSSTAGSHTTSLEGPATARYGSTFGAEGLSSSETPTPRTIGTAGGPQLPTTAADAGFAPGIFYMRYKGEYILPATLLPYVPHGPAVWRVSGQEGLAVAVSTLLREPLERRSRGHAAAQAAAKLASGLVSTVWHVVDDMVVTPALQDYIAQHGTPGATGDSSAAEAAAQAARAPRVPGHPRI